MKIFVILVSIIAVFVAAVQGQCQDVCPKSGEAPPCEVSCCESCNGLPQSGPPVLCGYPACFPKNQATVVN